MRAAFRIGFAFATALAAAASAQAQPAPQPDFLFNEPRGSVGVRVSWLQPRASSDLFTFIGDRLTVDKGDFNTAAVIGEAGIALTPQLDALFGVEWSRSNVPSEYRDFVDNFRLPIKQTTQLQVANITASAKVGLWPRGRSVGRFAWIPRTIAPYVGAGGGALYYDFTQRGDFVDFVDLSVFSDAFRSNGWAPSFHVFGGTEFTMWRALSMSAEARYVWARGGLGEDFVGFDKMDLSGLRLSTGVNVVF